MRAAAIVCHTSSSHTSLRAARERPDAPILSLTPSRAAARRLTLAWGAHSVQLDDVPQALQMTELACEWARCEGLAPQGEPLVMIASLSFGESSSTNLLRIAVA